MREYRHVDADGCETRREESEADAVAVARNCREGGWGCGVEFREVGEWQPLVLPPSDFEVGEAVRSKWLGRIHFVHDLFGEEDRWAVMIPTDGGRPFVIAYDTLVGSYVKV